jgi:hypothetical protein
MFGELFESFLGTVKTGTREERVKKCREEFQKYADYWFTTQSEASIKKIDADFDLSKIQAEFDK